MPLFKTARVPPDWDNTLPSDITLKLPGDDEPRILLTNRSEFQQAGLSLPEHPSFLRTNWRRPTEISVNVESWRTMFVMVEGRNYSRSAIPMAMS